MIGGNVNQNMAKAWVETKVSELHCYTYSQWVMTYLSLCLCWAGVRSCVGLLVSPTEKAVQETFIASTIAELKGNKDNA